ncbi:NEDD8-like protein RUB1 [Durusdinium trenchii]|uniref:NEDD8-like protein RUB1 n=1 Tax=Durusdinium trenchii TaxID=1381693 RepID=A0ABP0I921_9DINO
MSSSGVIPQPLDLMRHLGPALDGARGVPGAEFRVVAQEGAVPAERSMADDLEEETEILEDVDEEETEDVQATAEESEDNEDNASDPGEGSVHGETVTQDEVLEKYKAPYDQGLDRVKFPADITQEIQRTWQKFLTLAGSPEHAGELIFNAWWGAAPSLHSSFLTPRTVLYLRLVQGISPVISALYHPTELRTQIEIISFRHLDRPVSTQGVEILRDAMLDMWEAELQGDFTPKARLGWFSLLNYWGGALCYFQREHATRIKIIHRSWREANKSVALPEEEEEMRCET